MSRSSIEMKITDGQSRFAVVAEADGTFTVVDKKFDGGPDRYPVWHAGRSTAWREAVKLHEECAGAR